MNKSNFERFISKYHLNGLIGPVTITSDGSKLSVIGANDNKNAIASIETITVALDEGKYHIFDTAQLKSLLGVLGNEINISVKKNKFDVPISILITDGTTKVTAVLADEKAIPVPPKFKSIPPMEMDFKIDQEFITRFLKSKSALNEATQFVVLSNGKISEIIIGYSEDQNTTRIEVPLYSNSVKNTPLKTIYFSTEQMSAILVANKEATTGTLSIASNVSTGLAHLSFDIEGFTTTYYLIGEKQK
jgi:hypothetical protein